MADVSPAPAHALTAVDHAEKYRAANPQTARVLMRTGQYQQTRAELMSARDLLSSGRSRFSRRSMGYSLGREHADDPGQRRAGSRRA